MGHGHGMIDDKFLWWASHCTWLISVTKYL